LIQQYVVSNKRIRLFLSALINLLW